LAYGAQVHKAGGLEFYCLEERHFEPRVVETFPYEALSVRLAAIA
jgi:hypothetical protein